MPSALYPLFAAADAAAAPASGLHPALWHWLAFGAFVVVVLVLDLVVFHRHSTEPTLKESAAWTLVWTFMALAFNGVIWHAAGATAGIQFLTGYLVEWSLSMDNVFVFAVIFSFFRVPLKYQYRVLFWGILGAIVLRLAFILVGSALLERFDWVIWIFGVFLIYTGIKLAIQSEEKKNPDRSLIMRLSYKLFRVTKQDQGNRFFAREEGKFCVTPLFIVLLIIEATDVLFAFDSVPAIFGVTRDPFIVFSSNIFAILGLRALYFLLAGVMDMFHYLHYGLAAVLVFVGGKMLAEYFLDSHLFVDYPWASLLVIAVLLGASIAASLIWKREKPSKISTEQSPE